MLRCLCLGICVGTVFTASCSTETERKSPLALQGAGSSEQAGYHDQTFQSGINVAWVTFAHDIGSGTPNLEVLGREFAATAAAGGKIARLWIHANGILTPEFSGNWVTGPGRYTTSDLRKVLDTAQRNNVKLVINLWSFDMLGKKYDEEKHGLVARNRLLLTDDGVLGSYLDNALTPIVSAISQHPALHSIDICNEAEGMTVNEPWEQVDGSQKISLWQMQRFIGRIAGRIHRLAPQVAVTSASMSLRYLSQKRGLGNFYSDDALRAASGDPLASLNFYQAHFYMAFGEAFNPFHHPASAFELDKPVLIGEFYMQEYLQHGMGSPRDLYTRLRDQGYYGAMGWKDWQTPAFGLMLQAMRKLHYNEKNSSPSSDSCNYYQGGAGTPFFHNGVLYRTKYIQQGHSDNWQWCVVE